MGGKPRRMQCRAARQEVLEVVAELLGERVAADQPLMEAGLDSIGAVELRNAVAAKFGVELAATATLDHPTAAALAAHLVALSSRTTKLDAGRAGAGAAARAGAAAPRALASAGEDGGGPRTTHVVGMSSLLASAAAHDGAPCRGTCSLSWHGACTPGLHTNMLAAAGLPLTDPLVRQVAKHVRREPLSDSALTG
jgi:acyl carrier protein